jgi:16S rRNA (cytidine1402-2'-O)-methyltransferase
MTEQAALHLIPTPLGESDATLWQPAGVQAIVQSLDTFVVENAKTARAFVKASDHAKPMAELTWIEMDKHAAFDPAPAIALLKAGTSIGLLSEAGCPAVADPGNVLVAAAHREGITVKPLVGPSSIMLALMASGMNGQDFAFHGYLPTDVALRAAKLKELDAQSAKTGQTQLFIETPYRNAAMLEAALKALSPATRFGVACDLTLPTEWICVRTVAQWKQQPRPEFQKRPAVFLVDAAMR